MIRDPLAMAPSNTTSIMLPTPHIPLHTCNLMAQPLDLLPRRPHSRLQALAVALEALALRVIEVQVLDKLEVHRWERCKSDPVPE